MNYLLIFNLMFVKHQIFYYSFLLNTSVKKDLRVETHRPRNIKKKDTRMLPEDIGGFPKQTPNPKKHDNKDEDAHVTGTSESYQILSCEKLFELGKIKCDNSQQNCVHQTKEPIQLFRVGRELVIVVNSGKGNKVSHF